MADYLVTDTELTSIANAIRTKGGTSADLSFPTEFVSAINAISSGKRFKVGTFELTSEVSSGNYTIVTSEQLGFIPNWGIIYNTLTGFTKNVVWLSYSLPYGSNLNSYAKRTIYYGSSSLTFTATTGARNPSSAGQLGIVNDNLTYYAGSNYKLSAGTTHYWVAIEG